MLVIDSDLSFGSLLATEQWLSKTNSFHHTSVVLICIVSLAICLGAPGEKGARWGWGWGERKSDLKKAVGGGMSQEEANHIVSTLILLQSPRWTQVHHAHANNA